MRDVCSRGSGLGIERCAAQAQVGTWGGYTHNRRASTISMLTGQGHVVRRKREAGADKFGTCHRVKCQTRSCVAHFYSTGSRCWCGSGGNGAGREPAAWKEEKTEGQDENYEEANCGEAGPLRRP